MEEQTIGNMLRKIRINRDLTQSQLADLLGVGGTYISRVERGHQLLAPARLKILREKIDLSDLEKWELEKIMAESGYKDDESVGAKERAIERKELERVYQDLRIFATVQEVFPFSTELLEFSKKSDRQKKSQWQQWSEQIFIPTVKAKVAAMYLADGMWISRTPCFLETRASLTDQIELPRSIYHILMPLRSLLNIPALEDQGIQSVGAWPLPGIYLAEQQAILGRFLAGFDGFQHLPHVPSLPHFTGIFCNAMSTFLQVWMWAQSWDGTVLDELLTTYSQMQKWAEQLGPKESAIPASSLQELCKILAYSLQVEHVSCWLTDAQWQTIRCLARSAYPPVLSYTVQFSLRVSEPSMTRYIAQHPFLYVLNSKELSRHPAKRLPSLANEGLMSGISHGLVAAPMFAFANSGGLVYHGYLKFENPRTSATTQAKKPRLFSEREIQKIAWLGLAVAETLWTRPTFLGKEEVML